MRLSSKTSESSGLRQLSSIRSGVASLNNGTNSPFQPESKRAPVIHLFPYDLACQSMQQQARIAHITLQ